MESGDNRSHTDRISQLPGDILERILSSVRIRAIVRMRRLSRKWRRLCESLQFIHLDCRDFKNWKVEKFARFVNNLLLVRRKVDLHTFQLHWDNGPLNCNDVRMWVGYAVKHNVKVLDVKLYHYDKHYLPPGIFTCRSLQELNLQWGESPVRLGDHTCLEPSDIINLPSLKRLTLRDVSVSQLSLNRFIARSPALEDLHLIDCAEWVDCIASKSLKRLTLDGFTTGCCEFKICAPHLISFECKGYPLDVISWKDQPSIESVRIDCTSDVEIISCASEGESKCTVVFPGVLAHAKRLALFGSDIKVMLEKELPTCSVFESLTALEIGDWYLFEDLSIVLRFLQLSPRLEKLTLMHSSDDEGADTDGMSIDGMTFQCPFLESVIVQCSKGDDGIDKLVNVLVVNGINADKISITFREDIAKRAHLEWKRADEEWSKGIFEKMAEKNPEWIDVDPYATSDPNSEQGDAYDDEYVDDNF